MPAPSAPARSALVRIADFHTNIVREERDGEVLRDVAVPSVGGSADGMTDPRRAVDGGHLGLRHDRGAG